MAGESDFGAFIHKFKEPPSFPIGELPLSGLTFAVKDIFDIEGYVTGFGNPNWSRTHLAATSTAPAVLALLTNGAFCVGKTVMDEMAYSINGENEHFGTPINPSAADRVPGGSSSGSAVAVGASLVDFALGTDTGGSVRVPAAFCGILGFRPSHAAVSTAGVIPMAESFDTVGWFARDPDILHRVGQILMKSTDSESGPDIILPNQVIIAEDCFKLLSFIPVDRVTNVLVGSLNRLFSGQIIREINLGEYLKEKMPSLKHFIVSSSGHEFSITSLTALSSAMRKLQRYEFRNNHGEWVKTVKPDLGPGLSERIWEAVNSTDENVDDCHLVITELKSALADLLDDFRVLVIPTVPGPPPKKLTEACRLEMFRSRAFSLLSIAGVSGFCQVTIPLGMYHDLPVAVSLLAKHGADGFLLNLVRTIYGTLQEEVGIVENSQL